MSASNYPPGCSGNEYAIAGPDTEVESEVICPQCLANETALVTYDGQSWLSCGPCGHTWDEQYLDEDDGYDPDADADAHADLEYDRARGWLD